MALRGHPLLGPRTLGCGYKGRRVILWTDGNEPGACRATPLYSCEMRDRMGDGRVQAHGCGR